MREKITCAKKTPQAASSVAAPLSVSDVRTAEKFLASACGVMAGLIKKLGACSLASHENEPFRSLVTSIISQQLSSKAADAIEERVRAVVGNYSPGEVLSADPDELRAAGLSRAKVRYIRELSELVGSGELDFGAIALMPDDEAAAALMGAPGIGKWTAEMFLIFGLRRPDVMSPGDAGLQRAVRLLFGEGAKFEEVFERWRPYRSVASWYLWRSLDQGAA